MIEFRGTRRECFDWLASQGFRRDSVGWRKANWDYSFTNGYAAWDAPVFTIRAWKIEVDLPRKKRAGKELEERA